MIGGPGTTKVEVALGSRSYPIWIGAGLLSGAPSYLKHCLPSARFAIVADEAVTGYAEALRGRLQSESLLLGPVCYIPSGEGSKSFAQLERVTGALLDLGIERTHAVIALGGGVAGDLAGFAAAIAKRGVRLVQIPTTLLAQVDSSVGGKTGINARHGKNLIGAFHQPSLVLADLDTLATLPSRELRGGYAEVVKYGALGDASFFDWLERNGGRLLERDVEALTHAIETSCRMKAGIVARDEFERAGRALLNLGHTFGHAVEAWAGYSGDVLHGEAVALGMVLAARFSERHGYCGPEPAARIEAHFAALGFTTNFDGLERQTGRRPALQTLLAFMEQDKKVSGGEMTLILMRGIGKAFVAPKVSRAAIEDFLADELAV